MIPVKRYAFYIKLTCILFLYATYINYLAKVDLKVSKGICIPYQPKIIGSKWWYQLPYRKMKSVITREPDESINYTKITTKKYLRGHTFPKNLTTQSVVYITLMEDIFVQRKMIVKYNIFVRLLLFGKANFKQPIKQTVDVYEEMVYIHQFWEMYGHNIGDFLCALMFVPKELNDRGFYVLRPPTAVQVTYKIARYLNLNVTFITIPDERVQQIYAKKLWIITSRELAHGYKSGGIQRIRSIVFQKEEYKKIKPERYVVANRPVQSRRYFDDADKLVKILNEKTTIEKGCRWVRDDNSYGVPFQNILKYWMSLKVLVAVQGSGIYNGIFMHEKTGMCLLFSEIVDALNLILCSHLHIFTIGVIHPGRPIIQDKAYPTNYTDMVKYTQRVVDAVYNGNWTNHEGIKGFLNASYPVTNAVHFLYNYNEYAVHW